MGHKKKRKKDKLSTDWRDAAQEAYDKVMQAYYEFDDDPYRLVLDERTHRKLRMYAMDMQLPGTTPQLATFLGLIIGVIKRDYQVIRFISFDEDPDFAYSTL